MRGRDWSELAAFAAVAEERSFTRAAARLGVSPSALSHSLRSLEARLGVRLLNRTTRSTAPTEAGEALLARLRPALGEVEAALEGLNAGRDRPAGRLRISAHRTAAMHTVLPRLAAFTRDNPEITVELAVDDSLADIVAGRFDAGVRHEQRLEQDMVAVRIGGPVPVVVAASPAYLREHGTPLTPDDLPRHRRLGYRYTSSGALHRWAFEHEGRSFTVEPGGPLLSNDVDVLLQGALDGMGLACLSEPQVTAHVEAGRLLRVLEPWCPLTPANHLYWPGRRQQTAAFRAFVEAMRVRDA